MLLTPTAEVNTIGSYTQFELTVRDQYGNPWSGWMGWSTDYYNPTSANVANGNVYVSNGSATFGYTGYNVGEDTITMGLGGGQSGEGIASRTWVTTSPSLEPMPAAVALTPTAEVNTIGSSTQFELTVQDQYGNPWSGWFGWSTNYYNPTSANIAGGNFYVSDGFGSFGYTGYNAGEDTITTGLGGGRSGEGVASRTWAPLGISEVAPDEIGSPVFLETPLGQVLILDANVLQGDRKDGAASSCPDKTDLDLDYKDYVPCDPSGRRQRFANRISNLSRKLLQLGSPTDETSLPQDGMGYVPDVITLQEAYETDAEDIRDRLNAATGYQFGFQVAVDDESFSTNTNDHRAILYSTATMSMIDGGGYYVSSGGGAPSKAHLYAGFQERSTVGPAQVHGLKVAVASVHFPRAGEFTTNSLAPTYKAQWSREIASALESHYAVIVEEGPASVSVSSPVDAFVIAGDFNAGRCKGSDNVPLDEAGDAPSNGIIDEDPTCLPAQYWSDLASRGYLDTVFAANNALIRRQWRDGSTERKRRIDHIFAKAPGTYLAASFDRTCGEIPTVQDPQKRNCGWLQSPERYSDHRLVWALLGTNPLPLGH